MHSGAIGAILGGATDNLALLLRLVHPFASYRVYDVEHSQLVSAGCLFEVSIDLLDQYRFGLAAEE